MKTWILSLLLIFPFIGKAQAYLGSNEETIRNLHPDKIFKIGFTANGEKFISTHIKYGTFFYNFDNETGLSNFCMQVVNEIPYLNGQVEVYNKKYVIISDTEWKAYLKGGKILHIKLEYNDEHKIYIFYYTKQEPDS